MGDCIKLYRSLDDIGCPHIGLYEDGTTINLLTGKVRAHKIDSDIRLHRLDGSELRITLRRLISFEFYSPSHQPVCNWANLWPLHLSAYELTDDGRIYSLRNDLYMVQVKTLDGYHYVTLTDDFNQHQCWRIHRLVAVMFVPNPDNKPEVDHIDGNKDNNSASNLRWVYGWENVQYARENGLRKTALSDEQIRAICEMLQAGVHVSEIMCRLNVPKHAVLGIKSGCHRRISKDYDIPLNKHF